MRSRQIFSKVVYSNNLWGVVDLLEVQAAIQRDPARLEKWAHRNLTKITIGKCQILHLGRNKPMHQHRLGANWLESGSKEKDLEILIINRLSMDLQ